CSVNVINVAGENGVLEFVVAFCLSTVHCFLFRGHLSLLVHLCCPNHVVLHSGVLADVPSEGFLVEALRAFLVVGRYLKVYDPSVMHILHLNGRARNRSNKYSLYFSSQHSYCSILDDEIARV